MANSHHSIMIATLGGQPQIVTFALDALLAQGEDIREVIVLYLSVEGSRVNQALARLSEEFIDDRYTGRPCRLRPMAIRDGVTRLPDIYDEAAALATWEMLRELLTTLKRERHRLHVCISGGRRIMALVMISVATLQFEQYDKLWHVYTPDEMQRQAEAGAVLHAQPTDGVRLIEVPLVPLGIHFPTLQSLAQTPTMSASMPYIERTRCQTVIEALTERQLDVLKAFAAGFAPQQVAEQLNISLNTVNTHKRVIFDLCRNVWPDQPAIRYHHLREWFGTYFES